MTDLLTDLDSHGFARVPAVFTSSECRSIVSSAEALNRLSVGRDFRDRYGNVRFFSGEGEVGRQLRSVIWCGLLDAQLEALRRDARLYDIVRPLLGEDVRQVTNQLHLKFAGSLTSFQLHADRSSRVRDQGAEIRNLDTCFYQTAIVTEPMDLGNGGIYFVPGSHKWSGQTHYANAADGARRPDEDFEETMPEGCVPVVAGTGDVIVWHGNAVHGSAVRRTGAGARVLYVNGYVRGADSLRGYWAWIRGMPVPLPPIDVPVVVYGAPDFEAFELGRARALLEAYRAEGIATAFGA